MMSRSHSTLALASASLALSACASIVDGSTQVLSLKTVAEDGSDVADAQCTLFNRKGTWFTKTPGTVSVHRAYGPLNIECTKEAAAPGIAIVHSSTKGMAFGNIIAGGVIGAAVDIGSGAAYDYPVLVTVRMGRSIEIGAAPKPGASSPAPPEVAQ